MIQRVWLILAEVRVESEGNPVNLTVGSEALVQCFIPEHTLELALAATDRLLQSEGMRRIDVRSCRSFNTPEDEEDDDVADFVRKDLLLARESGHPRTGTFFTSTDSASFQDDVIVEDDTDKKSWKQ
jgi:hypothetical protein